MNVNVAKFGGSSLANAKQIKKVGQIVKENKRRKFIVVSAPGKRHDHDDKITDLLIKIGENYINNDSYDEYLTTVLNRFSGIINNLQLPEQLFKDIKTSMQTALKYVTPGYLDPIKAIGEDSCAKIVTAYLNTLDVEAVYLNPKDAGIVVSDNPGDAQILPNSCKQLNQLRHHHEVMVIPGFFGYTQSNRLMTFSRGGSDITGSIVAAGVKADLYENFTDVDSVYAVNPNIVNQPSTIDTLTYKEMRELSYAGFSVFHDEALIPAFKANIPVCIKNTNNPTAKGTMIVSHKKPTERCIVGIASDIGFCSLYVSKYLMNRELGFGRKLFQILEDECISFEHAPSGIDDMSIILREHQLTDEKEKTILFRIKNELAVDTVKIERNLAMIMIVGEGMKHTTGMAQKATTALTNANVNIEMINQGSSEVSMMFGIKDKQLKQAVQALYNVFFKNNNWCMKKTYFHNGV